MQSKKYWLRWGVAFSIVGLAIAVSFRLAALAGNSLESSIPVFVIAVIAIGPGLILTLIAGKMLGCQAFGSEPGIIQPAVCTDVSVQTIFVLFSVAIGYFVLGSIIGFVYGLRKKRLGTVSQS